MRFAWGLLAAASLLAASEVKIKLTDLPSVVRKAAEEQLKNATLVGVNKEVENGKTLYEIETKVNGRSRDVSFDSSGNLVENEEEVEVAAIPAAARDALNKLAAGAKMGKVEKVTAGTSVSYETTVLKNGKRTEVAVNADGSPHKD
jgi:uncharacterized membrane protein YkoI